MIVQWNGANAGVGTAAVPRDPACGVPWHLRRQWRLCSEAAEEMGPVSTHEEPERETEALRASHSRLSAANLGIGESPDLETVLHEALDSLRQGVR